MVRASAVALPLATATPREHLVPEHVRTWGPEAVKLAWVAGIACLPWQEQVLGDMLTERADGKWAAREVGVTVGRQNGKSILAVVRVLAGLYVLGEELLVYTAHQLKTAEEIFGRLVDKVEHTPELRARHAKTIHRAGEKGIELHSPKQRLIVSARSKESVRGFSADLIILDEAQMGLDEEDMAALGPTQRTRPNPQTIIMGTPPLGPGTWWGRFRRRALTGDAKMAWAGWTPRPLLEGESREQWRQDRAVWRETHPAHGILVEDEAIEHDRKTLGDMFDRECLCLWPREPEDAGWAVFTEGDWEDAVDPETVIVGDRAFAIEASHDLSHLSIGAAGRNGLGRRHLELAARFPTDEAKLIGWLKKRLTTWTPRCVVVDPAGPAGYLIAKIEEHCKIEVAKPLGRDVAGACGSVFVGISGEAAARDVRVRRTDPALMEPLTAAARRAVWRDRGDARVFDRRVEDDADPAPLMALALADWGMSVPAQEAQQQFFAAWR